MQEEKQPWCDGRTFDVEVASETYTEHPRVYFGWDKNNQAVCPYCGKVFKKNDSSNVEK